MDAVKVGKAIRILREKAGYTQKALAEQLHVSDKAVSKWERGLGLPDISLLGKLSVLLDTDSDSLLVGDAAQHDMGWNGLLVLDENKTGIGPDTVVFDKPLVYYLLSYFLLVGIKKIKIICSELAREYITKEILIGECFDISISFGSSVQDTVADEKFLLCNNVMIVYGKSLIYGVNMTRFFQKAMSNKAHPTALSIPKGSNTAEAPIQFDANRKIVQEPNEIPVKTQYHYFEIPVMFCPKNLLVESFETKADPYDISGLFQRKDIFVEAMDRGFVDIPLNDWDSIAEAAAFVRIMQKRCGMLIYCLEEVAWRRGMISKNNLRERALRKKDTEYGEYIMQLANE